MTDARSRLETLQHLDASLLATSEKALAAAEAMIVSERTPASARAAVIGHVFRAAGLFGRKDDGSDDLEPHEMSVQQLQRRINDLKRQQADKAKPVIDILPTRMARPNDGDVFG